MIKEGFIFNENRQSEYSEMTVSTEAYEIISNLIGESISEVLCKSYADRINFTSLISNAIKPQVQQLIKEHENHCLDVASSWIKNELELNDNINYENALHAKLSSLTEEIKSKFKENELNINYDNDIVELKIELNESKYDVEKLTNENSYIKEKLIQTEQQYKDLLKSMCGETIAKKD